MRRKYIIKRFFQSIFTLFAVLILNFFLFRIMPGDPIKILVRNPKLSEEAIQRLRNLFGLDLPLYKQFFVYLKNLLHGDLGLSFAFRKPVLSVIAERLWPTILLVGIGTILAIIIGMFIGVISAWKRGSKIDIASLGISLLFYSMPTFWLGIILVMFFAVFLRLFPTTGMVIPGHDYVNFWQYVLSVGRHLVLPSITLMAILMGQYVLIMRNSLIDVLTEPYIKTARAKGLNENEVLSGHAVPNAMLPLVTTIALSLGFVIAGAIQVETVFSWPGIGLLMHKAIMARDYPLLQGIFLFTSITVLLANFGADVLYSFLDPRVKTE